MSRHTRRSGSATRPDRVASDARRVASPVEAAVVASGSADASAVRLVGAELGASEVQRARLTGHPHGDRLTGPVPISVKRASGLLFGFTTDVTVAVTSLEHGHARPTSSAVRKGYRCRSIKPSGDCP